MDRERIQLTTKNKERIILILIVSLGIVGTIMGIDDSIQNEYDAFVNSSYSPITILSGILGMFMLILSIVAFPLVLGNYFAVGIILFAWSSIPLMIFSTTKIALKRRIPYIYFFVTYLVVVLSFSMREVI